MSSDILPTAQNAEVPTDNKATQDLLVLRENHQFDYSMAMLAAQERDRQAEREHLQSFCRASNRNWVIAGCFVLAVMMASFWMGKEQFLLECLKYLVFAGGGGGVGYVYGYRRRRLENIS